MGEVILESHSWEKGGEAARTKHLETVMEQAGLEIEKMEVGNIEVLPEEKLDEGNENLSQEERHERTIQNYGKQVEAAKRKYPDWQEVVSKSDINIGVDAQKALYGQANATDAVYWLCTHPNEARKLGKMPPIAAVAEVGRLSSRLRAETPYVPQGRFQRPSETASFEEIAATPNYWGKAKDMRRALRRR